MLHRKADIDFLATNPHIYTRAFFVLFNDKTTLLERKPYILHDATVNLKPVTVSGGCFSCSANSMNMGNLIICLSSCTTHILLFGLISIDGKRKIPIKIPKYLTSKAKYKVCHFKSVTSEGSINGTIFYICLKPSRKNSSHQHLFSKFTKFRGATTKDSMNMQGSWAI